jgi:type IV pilus assembly protein PilV
MSAAKGKRSVAGFTLIEILVALVIMLVGLMGAAGLMVRTVKQEVESYQRLQALNLLHDMVDRLNANRQVAGCYSNGDVGMTLGLDADGNYVAAADIPACITGSAGQNTRVNDDLVSWNTALQGVSERNTDNEDVGAMIGARGCIEQISAAEQTYRITVAWQGLVETVAAASDNSCGKDLYGSEALRRTISAIVRIGDLT